MPLARFKAKLIPKIDTTQIKDKIRFKTKSEAENIIKGMENILGSDIKKPNKSEIPLIKIARKSVVAARNIKKGEV